MPLGVVSPCCLLWPRGSKELSQPQITVGSIPKIGVLVFGSLHGAPARELVKQLWLGCDQPNLDCLTNFNGRVIGYPSIFSSVPSKLKSTERGPVSFASLPPPFRLIAETIVKLTEMSLFLEMRRLLRAFAMRSSRGRLFFCWSA